VFSIPYAGDARVTTETLLMAQARRTTRRTAALFASFLAACTGAPPNEPAAAQAVTVTVSPDSAVVRPGAEQAFAAAVTGSAVTTVTWSLREGASGGSLTVGGLYTAPAVTGIYHVVATSDADPAVSGGATVTVTVSAPAVVTVAVSPATRTLAAGASATFAATVGGTADTAVTWSVRESACGSITAGGLYTAPSAAATCHVVATSHADPTKSATATVTVTALPAAVAVTITPGTATVNACQNLTLSATVSGSSNTSLTWSVAEAAGGTVSGGVYTAPSSAGTYHVIATSQADPTKSATATLTAVEKVLGVAVSPATLALAPGATGQFTATVTTTCGSVSQLQTVTAPVN
jgi:hypothetical protein